MSSFPETEDKTLPLTKTSMLLIIPLAVLFLLLIPLKDGFTDDGFIHIQYAKNIITLGEYSFNPGQVSFGTTSPLWVMIHALLGWILGPSVLVDSSRIVSWLSGYFSLVVLFLLARRLSGSVFIAFLSTLVFACDAWFVRWTAMSMETSTAVLAMVLVGWYATDAFERGRSSLFLGFFIALATLLRPEAYLLIPVYAVSLFLQGGRIDSRCVARTLSVFLVMIVPWLLFAKLHIGSYLPNTAGAKSGGLILNPVVFIRKLEPIVKIVGSTQGVWALSIVFAAVLLRKQSRLFSLPCRFLLLWVVSLPAAYVLFDLQVLSRYLLLITPFIAVFGMIAADDVFARFGFGGIRKGIALTVLASVMTATSVAFYFVVVVPPSKAFSHNLTHELKDLALYIKHHSEEDAVVAAADIGYLAYFSDRKILDLGGLVEPVTGELREIHTYETIVEKGLYLGLPEYPRVDFFIDRELVADRFDGRTLQGYRFEKVLLTVIDNLGIRKPGPYYYTLYRLHRDAHD